MKRDLIHILFSAIWLVGIVACSSSEFPTNPEVLPDDPFKDGKIPVDIPVQTRAVNDNNPENRVENARLIVIKGTKITNNKEFTISTSVYTNDSVHVSDYIPVGNIELFIIVNERSEWDLNSLTIGTTCFPNDFEKKILSFTSLPVVNGVNLIPMYRQYRNLYVTPEGQLSIGGVPVTDLGVVERLYAKVTLRIGSIFADLANGGDPIQLDSISIKSMPKYSYLGPSWLYQEAANASYFDGARTHRTPAYEADDDHFLDTIVYYVPEHKVYYPLRTTYLAVKVSLKGNTDVDQQKEYKIAVGDGITSCSNDSMLSGALPLTNLFVTRNTHYHFTVNVKSFDMKGEQDIVIKPQVVAWDAEVFNVDFREYLLRVSQNEFKLPQSVVSLVVDVVTDHPDGWSATKTSARISFPTTYTGRPSGELKFNYTGAAITGADTIKVTAGAVTKHILVRNI
jgi:hypothetical protein